MNAIDLFGFDELSGSEMVEVTGGEARSFWYRVGQAAAEVTEFVIGVYDGIMGK